MVASASRAVGEVERAASRSGSTAPVGPTYIPALDGLRGIAILLVVVHHFAQYGGFQPKTAFDTVCSALAAAGWSGVDLFFVLSGFLITRILYQADREHHFFRNFYVRRTLRIFPLYYATLALFFVAGPILFEVLGFYPFAMEQPYRALIADQAWYWSYLNNIRIARLGWPDFNAIAHFWSLAIEEQFYLVWPFLVFFLGRSNLLRMCGLLIALALALRIQLAWNGDFLGAYVLAPARVDALAMGALLALIACGTNGLQPWRRAAALAGTAAAAALLAIGYWKRGLWTEDVVTITLGLTLLACLFGSVLVLAITSPRGGILSRVLTSRSLTQLGRYSYGVYVFHHPIALFMGRIYGVADLPLLFGSQVPALAAYTILGGGVSLAVAMLSWHVLEQPFLRLKDRFRYSGRLGAALRPAP